MSPPETTGDTLAATIDDLAEWFATYVYTRTPHAYIVLALWVVHTHTIEMVSTTPRIQVTSPQPGCGKTTLMEHLHRLVMNSEMGSHATPPLICRIVNIQQTTLLLDETDNLMNPKKEGVGDLTALLNAGYRKGQPQARLVQKSKNDANTDGDGWAVVRHKTYAAVALAGIGHHLPEALTSRCIQIELDRARAGQVTETDWDECELAAWALRDRIAAHADAIADDFSKPKPDVPGLHGRPREVWMPLLQLANIAGPDTYTKALAAYEKGGDAIPFPLVADPKLATFRAYRAYDDFEKVPLHGTFLVDASGDVRWQDVGHEPFTKIDFLLKEAKRLLANDSAKTAVGVK